MMASLLRSARLVRRATLPAAAFGAGYGACWMQGRKETPPQWLACIAARSYSGVARAARPLGRALPDQAASQKKWLAQVESRELRVLADLVGACEERGLDSAPLRRFVLRRFCEHAEADPCGAAIARLSGDLGQESAEAEATTTAPPPGGGLPQLIAELDRSVVALAAQGEPDAGMLPLLAAALHGIVVGGGQAWQRELGADGTHHLARAAVIATSWLAASMRRRKACEEGAVAGADGVSPHGGYLSSEDEDLAEQHLSTVWKELCSLPAGARVGQGWRRCEAETAETYRDLAARYAKLLTPPPARPLWASRPLQDFLPSGLRRHMAATMRRGTATAPVEELPQQPSGSSKSAESAVASAPSEGRYVLTRAVEIGSWAALLYGLAVALSADGFGCAPFHAVPTPLREPLRAAWQQQTVQVESLLAKHDMEGCQNGPSVVLGPWDTPHAAQD